MTSRLSLVCHGATSAVRTGSFPADEPLEPSSLAKITVWPRPSGKPCWTSPALRARQTARALGFEDAAPEPLLRECDYGCWAGLPLTTVEAQDPKGLAAWLADPAAAPHGGESLAGLAARVAAWMDGQGAVTGSVVAVTHPSVIRAAIVHALGAPPSSFWRIDIAPLATARLHGGPGRWTLVSLGGLGA